MRRQRQGFWGSWGFQIRFSAPGGGREESPAYGETPTGTAPLPANQPVALRAVFDDDHPETDAPLASLRWTLTRNGLILDEVGTGPELTATFSSGTYRLWVTCGDASDSVDTEVVSGLGTPPEIQIDAPTDGQLLKYVDGYFSGGPLRS